MLCVVVDVLVSPCCPVGEGASRLDRYRPMPRKRRRLRDPPRQRSHGRAAQEFLARRDEEGKREVNRDLRGLLTQRMKTRRAMKREATAARKAERLREEGRMLGFIQGRERTRQKFAKLMELPWPLPWERDPNLSDISSDSDRVSNSDSDSVRSSDSDSDGDDEGDDEGDSGSGSEDTNSEKSQGPTYEDMLESVQAAWKWNDNDKVVTVADVEVRAKDLRTFQIRAKVNDTALEGHLKLQAEQSKKSVSVLSTRFFTQLLKEDRERKDLAKRAQARGKPLELPKRYEKVRKWVKEGFFKKTLFVLPIHDNDHWMVVLGDLDAGVLTLHNSVANWETADVLEEWVELVADFINERHGDFKKAPPLPALTTAVNWDARQQKPGSEDCGLHVIEFTRQFLQDEDHPIPFPGDMDKARVRAAYELLDQCIVTT